MVFATCEVPSWAVTAETSNSWLDCTNCWARPIKSPIKARKLPGSELKAATGTPLATSLLIYGINAESAMQMPIPSYPLATRLSRNGPHIEAGTMVPFSMLGSLATNQSTWRLLDLYSLAAASTPLFTWWKNETSIGVTMAIFIFLFAFAWDASRSFGRWAIISWDCTAPTPTFQLSFMFSFVTMTGSISNLGVMGFHSAANAL